MTEAETLKLASLLIDQVGLDEHRANSAMAFWCRNFVMVDYEKCVEGLRSLLLNDTVKTKEPIKWFAAVLKYAGGVLTEDQKAKWEQPGCERCRFSGCIEVPHHADWIMDRWKGQYTMVVACECGAGQMKATQISTIRYYESKFGNWEYEMPRRMLERRLGVQEALPVPHDDKLATHHKGRIHFIRAALLALDGEVI